MHHPIPFTERSSGWGEGPVWYRDHLWYVNIHGHLIIRLDPVTGTETVWDVGQQVGFVRPCSSGRMIWGGDHGLYFLDPVTGESMPVVDPETDKPDNRFNDAGISPDGRLFAGTISRKKTPTANLYRLDADLTCQVAVHGVTNSNGIVWSADAKRCFYIDTPTRKVMRYTYLKGELLYPECHVDTSDLTGSPDGMTIDAEGHLWVAFCHGGCVIRFHGETGRQLDRIDVPCIESTACTFGGPGLRDLYITTGKKEGEELGGRLFVVRDMPVAGVEGVVFRDTP